jgi:5-enolpyruvylshikimate-3-phosphate synthase
MVLAFSVAGLGARGETKISDAQMVEKSFDTYIGEMRQSGADFEVVEEA